MTSAIPVTSSDPPPPAVSSVTLASAVPAVRDVSRDHEARWDVADSLVPILSSRASMTVSGVSASTAPRLRRTKVLRSRCPRLGRGSGSAPFDWGCALTLSPCLADPAPAARRPSVPVASAPAAICSRRRCFNIVTAWSRTIVASSPMVTTR